MTLSKEKLTSAIESLMRHPGSFFGDAEAQEVAAGLRELLERRERDKQEPVAWIVHARTGDQLTQDGGYVANAEGMSGIDSTPLYAAPSAPAVTSEPVRYMNRYTGACYTLEQQPDAATDTMVYVPLFDVAQPVAVPDEHYKQLSDLYHAQEKRLFKLAQRIKGSAFDKYAYSPSQAIDVLESALFGEDEEAYRAAMLKQPSSIPISNGEGARAEIKQPASNSPVSPDCWCRACLPVVMANMRFVVCPECGNKRCPKANDHRNACTGSNEPGQEGSAYPAAPGKEG